LSSQPEQWHGTWFGSLGATWRPDPNWTFRGGLPFDPTPVRDQFRTARLPDSDQPEVPDQQRIRFRIGLNLGDVIVEEHDIFGDGVNVAARLEALAEPGGVFVSNTVCEHVRDRLPFAFEDLGEQARGAKPAAGCGITGQLIDTSLSRLVLDHSVRREVGNESCIVLRNDFGPHGCYRPLARDGTGSQTFWWQDLAGHSAARRA
jgi:hypothetical protein